MIRKELKNASQLTKIIEKQKALLEDFNKSLGSFNAEDLEIDPDDFEDLVDDFHINNKKLTDAIKQILFSFREQ